jgi:hypothetical protein
MLLLKKELVIVIEGSSTKIDIRKIGYVKDEDYSFLSINKEARVAFLDHLGVTELIVERLGVEVEPNMFKRKDVKLDIPTYEADREMGYYHRI